MFFFSNGIRDLCLNPVFHFINYKIDVDKMNHGLVAQLFVQSPILHICTISICRCICTLKEPLSWNQLYDIEILFPWKYLNISISNTILCNVSLVIMLEVVIYTFILVKFWNICSSILCQVSLKWLPSHFINIKVLYGKESL